MLATSDFSSGGNLHSHPMFHRKTAPMQPGNYASFSAVVKTVFRFPTEFPYI
jgi:hypothetical protein